MSFELFYNPIAELLECNMECENCRKVDNCKYSRFYCRLLDATKKGDTDEFKKIAKVLIALAEGTENERAARRKKRIEQIIVVMYQTLRQMEQLKTVGPEYGSRLLDHIRGYTCPLRREDTGDPCWDCRGAAPLPVTCIPRLVAECVGPEGLMELLIKIGYTATEQYIQESDIED
jgi:preprotein translocase subunit Sss1